MSLVSEYKEKVLAGELLSREMLLALVDEDLEELTSAANEIRKEVCDNAFDMCTIINGKCGRCSENCKFCAQSAHYDTGLSESYPLLDTDKMVEQARKDYEAGVLRFSIVTCGKRLSDDEVDKVCDTIKAIREQVGIPVCVSFGLLNEDNFKKIKAAGASRVHCNLETSRNYFPDVCTTHTYDEKIETIKAAKAAGLTVCSGGIMGIGETMEDRIDMVLEIRELGVKSIPVNLLNPIKGTPFENNRILTNDELCRIVAIYRFAIPDANIRLAGGRGLVGDKGEKCFRSGANAAISGDMLTTAGITTKTDIELLEKLGFEIK